MFSLKGLLHAKFTVFHVSPVHSRASLGQGIEPSALVVNRPPPLAAAVVGQTLPNTARHRQGEEPMQLLMQEVWSVVVEPEEVEPRSRTKRKRKRCRR